MHDAIQRLRENGWTIHASRAKTFKLPAALRARYGDAPTELAALLTGVKECVSPDGKAWLLCHADYSGKSKSAFRWNQWELLSLDCADGDAELEADITSFWDSHLPIYMSVRDGYAFAAVCLKGRNKGRVVEGREPEFEEVSVVANGLLDFVGSL